MYFSKSVVGREAGGLSRVIACVDSALLHEQSWGDLGNRAWSRPGHWCWKWWRWWGRWHSRDHKLWLHLDGILLFASTDLSAGLTFFKWSLFTSKWAVFFLYWAFIFCKQSSSSSLFFLWSLGCSKDQQFCGDRAAVILDAEELLVSEYQYFFPHPNSITRYLCRYSPLLLRLVLICVCPPMAGVSLKALTLIVCLVFKGIT